MQMTAAWTTILRRMGLNNSTVPSLISLQDFPQPWLGRSAQDKSVIETADISINIDLFNLNLQFISPACQRSKMSRALPHALSVPESSLSSRSEFLELYIIVKRKLSHRRDTCCLRDCSGDIYSLHHAILCLDGHAKYAANCCPTNKRNLV